MDGVVREDDPIVLDHAFGNCIFANLGATVISHDADRASLAKTGAETLKNAVNYGLKPEDMAGTGIVAPTAATGQVSKGGTRATPDIRHY